MLYLQKWSWCENGMEVQNQFTSLLFKMIFSKFFFFNHSIINLGYLQFTAETYYQLIIKHKQHFAGSRSYEENPSKFIIHTHPRQ